MMKLLAYTLAFLALVGSIACGAGNEGNLSGDELSAGQYKLHLATQTPFRAVNMTNSQFKMAIGPQ